MANGMTGPNGTFTPPNWVKVAVYIGRELGVHVLIMGVIIGVFFGWIPSPMLDQHEKLLDRQQSIHGVLGSNQELIVESSEQLDELIYVNRAVCVNNSQSDAQRERCLQRHD